MTPLLRSLIRQVLLESDGTYKPEAPADAPLGKYAFANNREYSPKPPHEDDTEVEKTLHKNLIDHFKNDRKLSKVSADQILGFIEKDLYSDIFFRAPSSGTLYRGLNSSQKRLVMKFLPKNVTIDDIYQQIAEETNDFASFETQFDLTNKSENYTASWTKSLEKAKEFAMMDIGTSDFEIILCASIEDNPGKWIDCEGLYRLHDIDIYEGESEVIAAGTIRVNKVMIKLPQDEYATAVLDKLENLPKDQRIVKGNLNLSDTRVTSLPAGLEVGGSLYLRDTDITSLPTGLKVGGTLDITSTGITSLPAGLQVGGDIWLSDTSITSLPAGLEVGGSLYLRDAPITSLPAGLKVGKDLYLFGTGITSLPADLQVGGVIFNFNKQYWAYTPQHLKDKLR